MVKLGLDRCWGWGRLRAFREYGCCDASLLANLCLYSISIVIDYPNIYQAGLLYRLITYTCLVILFPYLKSMINVPNTLMTKLNLSLSF